MQEGGNKSQKVRWQLEQVGEERKKEEGSREAEEEVKDEERRMMKEKRIRGKEEGCEVNRRVRVFPGRREETRK